MLVEVSQRSLGGQRQPLSSPLCLVVTPFVLLLPTLLLGPWGQAFPLLQIQIRDPYPACLLLTGSQRGMIKEIKARRKKERAWGNMQAGSGVKTHLATRHPGESLWALVCIQGAASGDWVPRSLRRGQHLLPHLDSGRALRAAGLQVRLEGLLQEEKEVPAGGA